VHRVKGGSCSCMRMLQCYLEQYRVHSTAPMVCSSKTVNSYHLRILILPAGPLCFCVLGLLQEGSLSKAVTGVGQPQALGLRTTSHCAKLNHVQRVHETPTTRQRPAYHGVASTAVSGCQLQLHGARPHSTHCDTGQRHSHALQSTAEFWRRGRDCPSAKSTGCARHRVCSSAPLPRHIVTEYCDTSQGETGSKTHNIMGKQCKKPSSCITLRVPRSREPRSWHCSAIQTTVSQSKQAAAVITVLRSTANVKCTHSQVLAEASQRHS
jgi:hypothetical protein